MLINDNGKNLMGKKDIVFDNEQKKAYSIIKASFSCKKNKIVFSDSFKWFHLWGPVGRGKSMIIGLIFNEINLKEKVRIHYQHLMKKIHKGSFLLKKDGYKGNAIEKNY